MEMTDQVAQEVLVGVLRDDHQLAASILAGDGYSVTQAQPVLQMAETAASAILACAEVAAWQSGVDLLPDQIPDEHQDGWLEVIREIACRLAVHAWSDDVEVTRVKFRPLDPPF